MTTKDLPNSKAELQEQCLALEMQSKDRCDAKIGIRYETRDRLRELSHHTYDSLITWLLDRYETEIREGNKRFEL